MLYQVCTSLINAKLIVFTVSQTLVSKCSICSSFLRKILCTSPFSPLSFSRVFSVSLILLSLLAIVEFSFFISSFSSDIWGDVNIITSLLWPTYYYLFIITSLSLPSYYYLLVITSLLLPPYYYLLVITSLLLPTYYYLLIIYLLIIYLLIIYLLIITSLLWYCPCCVT